MKNEKPMILRTENLVKKYGERTVANLVSINVEQGEIVGLLGPNGAGKTTTFYMTTGLIVPNEGRIFLNDLDITKYPVYKRAQIGIGYLAQEASVFRKMSVEDNIRSVLEMTKFSKEYQKEKLESLIAEFNLEKVRKNLGDRLSGGERRRTEIARCLAIEPKFIMLDEPFAGVDPIAVQDIQEIVWKLKDKNIGILITDHNVDETLTITDRAYLLFEGKILFQGTPEELAANPTVREKYLGKDFELKKRGKDGVLELVEVEFKEEDDDSIPMVTKNKYQQNRDSADLKGEVKQCIKISHSAEDVLVSILLGTKTSYEFDLAGNMIRETSYDEDNNISSDFQNEFDKNNHLITRYDSISENRWKLKYDSKGRLRSNVKYDSSGRISNIIRFEYAGNLLSQEIGRDESSSGWKLLYEYDSLNRLVKETKQYGNGRLAGITYYEYDENSRVKIEKNYDENGNFSYSKEIKYNDNGDEISSKMTGENERVAEWEYKYDKKGNWIKIFVIENGEKRLNREREIMYY